MFILPTRPQSVLATIRTSFNLWRSSLWNLLILTLLAIFVGTLPHFFVSDLNSFNLKVILQFIHRNYFFFAIYIIVALFFLSAILYRIHMFISGKTGGLAQAFLLALARLPYTFTASFLVGVLVALGCAFFLIPGIYALILFAFYQPLVLIERLGPIQALHKSCQLVRNHWWRVFGVFALTALVYQVIFMIIETSIIELIVLSETPLKIRISYGLFRLVISSLYYPFLCCIQLVLWHDLKLRLQIQQESETSQGNKMENVTQEQTELNM